MRTDEQLPAHQQIWPWLLLLLQIVQLHQPLLVTLSLRSCSVEMEGRRPIIEPLCYSLISPPRASQNTLCKRSDMRLPAQPRDAKTLYPTQRAKNPMTRSCMKSRCLKTRTNERNEILKNYNTTFNTLSGHSDHLTSLYGKAKQNILRNEMERETIGSLNGRQINEQNTPKGIRSLRNAQRFFNPNKRTAQYSKEFSDYSKSRTETESANKSVNEMKGKSGEFGMKSLDLTDKIKKQIILTMLKESKIPMEIIAREEKYLKTIKDQQLKLEKLSEAILASYDVIVQAKEPYQSVIPGIIHKRAVTREKIKRQVPAVTNKSFISKTTPNATKIQKQLPAPFMIPSKKLQRKDNEGKLLNALPEGVKDFLINTKIALINKYTSLLFRNKESHYNLKAINLLHRKLGLGKQIQNEEELKSRERVCQIKEALLRLLYSTLNRENMHTADTTSVAPRYFIGSGNNSPLVKSLLRERWWWVQGEDGQKPLNLLWTQWRRMDFISTLGTTNSPLNENISRISNHLEGNCYLGHKKNMYKCLSLYYSLVGKKLSDAVPLTFHIKGRKDPEYEVFKALFTENEARLKAAGIGSEGEDEEASETELDEYTEYETAECDRNLWIIKPGENTNRGNGIIVSNNLYRIAEHMIGLSHTYIMQKYIERPLLFEKRKFDIRCFVLVTSINGYMKAFYYQEGYLRTSSKDYSVRDLSRSVHLTNEAVQIHNQDFGKHEAGNKVSYSDFNKYLHAHSQDNDIDPPIDLFKNILPRIKVIGG
eukprot:TRINITY_DN5906_c0_g1_i6.p1 TRINITY_DN5906_c0_g1~~TRINITY_DN5906_c0_g1_i6.p1  ORF type:complete len:764 (-),score=128.07 TRINITY_DN5906_c0_g1_i6:591-2882(-)